MTFLTFDGINYRCPFSTTCCRYLRSHIVSDREFNARKMKIRQIADTIYPTLDCSAAEYLAAIAGAPVEEQPRLFAVVLQNHHARRIQGFATHRKSIPDLEKMGILHKVSDTVDAWSRTMLRDNLPLQETANFVWENLTLFEGNDRIIALAHLLHSKAVPYAQIPPGSLSVKTPDYYLEWQEKIPEELALIMRLKQGEFTAVEWAVAIVRMLREIDEFDAQVALLLPFLEKVRLEEASRNTVIQDTFRMMTETFSAFFDQDEEKENNHN